MKINGPILHYSNLLHEFLKLYKSAKYEVKSSVMVLKGMEGVDHAIKRRAKKEEEEEEEWTGMEQVVEMEDEKKEEEES
ncbi:hypothetical protein E2C01_020055 [Portunus trituberculatus]|uniref:Uncharacterized protein n=1 Tax=Portunus trituberculatus TaxID=210409 RepID=A0A5B7E242_PORTR|nr:hypothetical protein [Portunus trituberculatus]